MIVFSQSDWIELLKIIIQLSLLGEFDENHTNVEKLKLFYVVFEGFKRNL